MAIRPWVTQLGGVGDQTGLLVAAAGIPGTFEPSLVPRGVLDQALITGLAMSVSHVLSAGTQDLIEAIASTVAGRVPGATSTARQRHATFLLDLAVVPFGLAVQAALPGRPGEPVLRGLVRQVAWRVTVTGVGGVLFAVAKAGFRAPDDTVAGRRLSGLPIGVPAGLILGWTVEAVRRRRQDDRTRRTDAGTGRPAVAVGASLGVATALSAAAYGERLLADATGSLLSSRLPGGSELWRPVGHAAILGGLSLGGLRVFQGAVRRMEAATSVVEPVLDEEGGQRWIGATVSGGTGSLVPWQSLGREGRRHVLLYPRPSPVHALPPGMPDLSIETVTGRPALADPALVYVGLDSAPTVADRVALALAEMDRTNAWDRSLLMLVSPTGSGYVNYCATAAASYLTRGDIAIVTLQYSKRPSPLSLSKVKDAREQNRLLWLNISGRLRKRGGSGPRVVLFGESLGAHTSQDALLHWGTVGPQSLGIERALWIGTPYASGWMRQVTGPPRPDVDPNLVLVVNDFAQIQGLSPERRSRLRYVLVSHDNDGVTKLGLDLVASRPSWLTADRPPVEDVPDGSPRGVPAGIAGGRSRRSSRRCST